MSRQVKVQELVREIEVHPPAVAGNGLLHEVTAHPDAAMRALPRVIIQEHAAQHTEQRAFTTLGIRFDESPAGEFFLGLASGVESARTVLLDAASRLESPVVPRKRPVPVSSWRFEQVLAWLALRGSRAEAGLAVYADLLAWGAQCSEFAEALRVCSKCPPEVVSYFEGYAQPPRAVLESALDVVEHGLNLGDDPVSASAAAEELCEGLTHFWECGPDITNEERTE